MLVKNRNLDGMKGNHGVEKCKREADRNRPSEQGEDIYRIDKGEADEYICVSSDVLANEMRRCDEEVSG